MMDLSNCITDDITTCNTGGLRPKPVYLCVLFYDFFLIPNDCISIFEYANNIICISVHGSKDLMSKLSFSTIFNSPG